MGEVLEKSVGGQGLGEEGEESLRREGGKEYSVGEFCSGAQVHLGYGLNSALDSFDGRAEEKLTAESGQFAVGRLSDRLGKTSQRVTEVGGVIASQHTLLDDHQSHRGADLGNIVV